MAKEVPVFLFLGFLESGKTKFIQETLEDDRFDSGERTLLLVCEEGEEEYDVSRFAVKDFNVAYLSEKDITPANLLSMAKKYRVERVAVEYNGMLSVQSLFDAMPENWMPAQIMTFFEAGTFLSYNANMRQLVYDKIQYADLVVFNRFDDRLSKEEFHKIVRGCSRRPDIVFEYSDGKAVYDDISDELPYDVNAKMIEIEDRDYAFFYRDLMEDFSKYNGKMVKFKGLVAVDKRLKEGTIVVGRHIMTCCEADIAYSGLVCLHASVLPLKTRDWVRITARIDVEYHKIYGQEGPVLKVSALDYCEPPEQELATFY